MTTFPDPAPPPPAGTASAPRRAPGAVRTCEVVLALSGDVDATTRTRVARWRLALAGALAERPGARVVVDASGVAFMDLTGLRAVAALLPPGQPLVLRDPSRRVRRLVDVATSAQLVTRLPAEVAGDVELLVR